MNSIKSFMRQMLTEVDNQTYELGRFLWLVSVMLGLGLEIAAFITARTFDLQAYGLGTAAILGAGGVVTALKSSVENKAKS